jgi:hypothetical protein
LFIGRLRLTMRSRSSNRLRRAVVCRSGTSRPRYASLWLSAVPNRTMRTLVTERLMPGGKDPTGDYGLVRPIGTATPTVKRKPTG